MGGPLRRRAVLHPARYASASLVKAADWKNGRIRSVFAEDDTREVHRFDQRYSLLASVADALGPLVKDMMHAAASVSVLLLMPCRHAIACAGCAEALVGQPCSRCRQRVDNTMKDFPLNIS